MLYFDLDELALLLISYCFVISSIFCTIVSYDNSCGRFCDVITCIAAIVNYKLGSFFFCK